MGSRILVVDDDKAIRDFLFEALTRLGGYQVEVAGNAVEALERVKKEDFDLVLTDMKMPNMDGIQLIGDIAKIKPETLIVMMTGHGTIDTALDAMKRGASDYLTKPVNLDEMLLRLQRAFAQRERFMS